MNARPNEPTPRSTTTLPPPGGRDPATRASHHARTPGAWIPRDRTAGRGISRPTLPTLDDYDHTNR